MGPTADVAGHSPEHLLRRTVCASLPTARSLSLFQLKTFASVPAEGAPGCPSQHSASCPRTCDADAKAPHNDFASDKWTFGSSSGRQLLGGGGGGVQHASGEAGIQKAIMEGGPVETAFTVYTDFANYASGIYHHVSGGVEGGHAVR